MGMYEVIKDGVKIAQATDNVELLKNFMEIQNGYVEIQEQLGKARIEIKYLNEKLELKDKLDFKDNMYYLVNENGEEGPFCSRCYDERGKLVRMHILSNGFQCPIDSNVFVQTAQQIQAETQSLYNMYNNNNGY